MRVLVIEDNPAYLAACVAVLTEDGHAVIACGSFEEGQHWLAQDVFDALIADVRLGPYNGLHLITLAPPATIKVAISAFPDGVLCRYAEQVGARLSAVQDRIGAAARRAGRDPAEVEVLAAVKYVPVELMAGMPTR